MGVYLNPDNPAFRKAVNSGIYVDKSGLISYTNKVINTQQRYICMGRPECFGKTMAADMLAAYYSSGCSSEDLFDGLEIVKDHSYRKHLNRHNVIYLNMQHFFLRGTKIDNFIDDVQNAITTELKEAFGENLKSEYDRLPMVFNRIFLRTGERFVFIVDEWDYIFRFYKKHLNVQQDFMNFLCVLFKDQVYAELVYMTGILPVKKYGTHSSLNMFDEFTMVDQFYLDRFFGFTETEVRRLCSQSKLPLSEMQQWYDGYVLDRIHIYNPKSVVSAVQSGQFKNYWASVEDYETLQFYVNLDFPGLKEAVTGMLGDVPCKICPRTFLNDMITFKRKDDVLTLLVHLGYLAFDETAEKVYIPNREIRNVFLEVAKISGWEDFLCRQ